MGTKSKTASIYFNVKSVTCMHKFLNSDKSLFLWLLSYPDDLQITDLTHGIKNIVAVLKISDDASEEQR